MTLARIEELIAGSDLPVGIEEEYFLASYLAGKGGELLLTYLVGFGTKYDEMGVDELYAIMIGYSMGQNDLIKIEDELLKTTNKNPEGLH